MKHVAPPHNLELEEIILGSILSFSTSPIIEDMIGMITPELFYDSKHNVICRAIMALRVNNFPIDMLTVVKELRNMGKLEEVGGAFEVSQYSNRIVSVSNFEFHLRILQQIQMRRDIINHCTKAITDANDETSDPIDMISSLGGLFSAKMDEFCDRKEVTSLELCEKTIQTIKLKKYNQTVGIYTGFPRLDMKLGGFGKNKLYIIGARPAMGKTALALSFAYNAAKQGKDAVFFSLEMDNEEIMKRLISIHTSVSVSEMDTLTITDSQIQYIENAKKEIGALPIHFDDSPYCTLSHLRARCKKLQKKGKLQIVFVDYIQLMRSENTKKNMTQNDLIGELSKGLKGLAKELKVPIIALSQLSREVEKRSDKEPQLSDLRESGSIEQDADCVMFLWRPEVYNDTSYIKTSVGDLAPQGIACLKIAKNRQGGIFMSHLNFEHKFTRFGELTDSRIIGNFTGF